MIRSTTCSSAALLAALVLVVLAVPAASQQTAFTYQGVLKDGGTPVTTSDARFIFRLWSAETGGGQIGSDYVSYPVMVDGGVFNTQIDFGLAPFEDGAARWLEIGVDATGGTEYEWLSPRQLLTTVPSALYAANSGDSYWRKSGGTTVTDHEVGIGTDAPTSPLEIVLDDDWPAGDVPTVKVTQDYCDGDEGYPVHATLTCPLGSALYGSATSNDPYAETYGVQGVAASDAGAGVWGWSTGAYGTGVFGSVGSGTARAVYGRNTGDTGDAIAVEGYSPSGFAGYFRGKGYFQGRLGVGTLSPQAELDVVGSIRTDGLTLSTTPADGYVLTSDALGNASWQAPAVSECLWEEGTGSDIYFYGGNVGVGMNMPAYPLDVYGAMRAHAVYTDAFSLSEGGASGYVLTSDSSGDASWQPPPGGFSLPYDGAVSYVDPAFRVVNSVPSGSTGHAVYGLVTGAASTAAAGYFSANGTDGCGVKAYSDGDDAVYCRQTGTTAYALYASTDTGPAAGFFSSSTNNGSAAEFSFAGASGSGVSVETTGDQGYGVSVETTGSLATGINVNTGGIGAAAAEFTTTGSSATGLVVDAQGAESTGARIESPYIGLIAKGSVSGARIYGNVAIYEYGTSDKVLELGKGLDYAEGFAVTGGKEGACPGSVLVIDADAPGRLTESTRPYDKRVAGIVAGARGLGSGVRLGTGEFDHDVALAGRVYCNVVATEDDIEPGDMLTTSNVPGYAMKASDLSRSHGAILGKAMEPLAKGQKGQILVLVTLQ